MKEQKRSLIMNGCTTTKSLGIEMAEYSSFKAKACHFSENYNPKSAILYMPSEVSQKFLKFS